MKYCRIVGAALAFAAAAAVSLTAMAADTIKIGLIEPFSGPIAAVGLDQYEAMETIAEEINANGGVLGRNIEIVKFDNAMKAEKTTAAQGD